MSKISIHHPARPRSLRPVAWAALALLLGACTMIMDDRSDCPSCRNPLHVVLRYDYNMQRANMFADHVQQATVYVADAATGVIVASQTVANDGPYRPLELTSFAFNFEDLPAGDYRLMATATAPAATATNPCLPLLGEGDALGGLFFRLADESQSAVALDTVWTTVDAHVVSLPENEPLSDTLSLMRLTNNLSLMLVQTQNPADNGHDRYDVRIVDRNARLDADAQPEAGQQAVTYRPYDAWTTETLADDIPATARTTGAHADGTTRAPGDVVARTAHYDLSFSRLVAHPLSQDNARLVVTNRADGTVIADLDLVYYLALARNATERRYPVQEFLDREYDYRLDVVLAGNEWRYMTLSINVLAWTLHIQNEDL